MAIEKRTYADADRAKAAVDELSSNGFSDVRAWFKPNRAGVAVNAPFGEGQRAEQILDRHGPLISNEEVVDEPELFGSRRPVVGIRSGVRDSAAPLSSFFGWPVLIHGLSWFAPKALINDPAPLSSWLGWPTLYGSLNSPSRGPAAPVRPRPSKDEQTAAETTVGE